MKKTLLNKKLDLIIDWIPGLVFGITFEKERISNILSIAIGVILIQITINKEKKTHGYVI
jgi:hypothetical protein